MVYRIYAPCCNGNFIVLQIVAFKKKPKAFALGYSFFLTNSFSSCSYTRYCELILLLLITRRIVSANISATDSCLTLAQRLE